ncbi:hypothetical protein L0128_07330 [candidate division KSB1 bacterium]|nr:hypothetical protein [candidate division KSB1 bacterium]
MGISIHYRGTIKDPSMIPPLQEELADICQSMKWNYQLWNEDWNLPFDASIKSTERGIEVKGHVPLKGINIHFDPKDESLALLFNPQRQLTSFVQEILRHDGTLPKDYTWISVKTQFGSVNSHIAVIKLLRYLQQSYITDLEVHDEGQYWETNDKERLLELRGFLFNRMAELEKALSDLKLEDNLSTDELIAKIETAIKRIQKKN